MLFSCLLEACEGLFWRAVKVRRTYLSQEDKVQSFVHVHVLLYWKWVSNLKKKDIKWDQKLQDNFFFFLLCIPLESKKRKGVSVCVCVHVRVLLRPPSQHIPPYPSVGISASQSNPGSLCFPILPD